MATNKRFRSIDKGDHPNEHLTLTPDSRIVSYELDDLDAYAELLKPLSLNYSNQLTPGNFKSKLNCAKLPEIEFTTGTQNKTIYLKGPKSENWLTFAMAFKDETNPIISHGIPIKKCDLFGFDKKREVNLILGEKNQVTMINVHQQKFLSLAQMMGYEKTELKILTQNIARFPPSTVRHLRSYYDQIAQILECKPELLGENAPKSLIIEDFLPLLLDTLGAIARENRTMVKPLRRYPIVKKAEDFMYSYPNEPLTLKQLCDALGTSSTALSAGFKEIFGVSPMTYLKRQRLNGVHRALKNADPNGQKVMQIAQEWGFWSLNHFSRDYQKMFGELPSQTLKVYQV